MEFLGTVSTFNRRLAQLKVKKLEFQLKQMAFHNRDGSYGTQKRRRSSLAQIARQLHGLGFNQMSVHSLRRKHVDALLVLWRDLDYSVSTTKNYMSHLRWWARKVGKEGVIPEDNQSLTIPSRNRIPDQSKAQNFDRATLDSIPDERIRLSVELQQEFGLRKEECLKFRPSYADQGTLVRLKGSWTKGGRPREIPVVTELQRRLLDRAAHVVRAGSMIPEEFSYAQWSKHYEAVADKCGFKNLHGLRHGYAQRRYQSLVGWPAPFAGGPSRKALAPDKRIPDQVARLQVSRELGHNRIEITDVYLGR